MADNDKKVEKKSSSKVTKLVDDVSKLSVLELSELVSALQEKLGVSAMPQAAAVAAPAGQAPATPAPDQGGGVQTVILTETGANKISVIKALREINQNLTLMDAKAMTETVPAEVLKEAKAEEAKAAADKLKAAGATVELK
ncbi:MAG: ribosomal protein L7/L12 [bacterium]|nr:ribosomal protein L7/L12 [bacterium]